MNELVAIAQYAEKICAAWRRSAESIIETGRLLIQAKAELDHGSWLALLDNSSLPFKRRVAQCLMEIAEDERFANAQTIALLPAEWSTIHAYSKIKNDARFNHAVASGVAGAQARNEAKASARDKRERELGENQRALPEEKFGVILADPEWRFEPWSRETGLEKSADNHYPTSVLEVIKARDVPSIAADDCVLFLWATVPMLPQALMVMGAWGFDYRSHYIWGKTRDSKGTPTRFQGTGYWNRNGHELLLIGVKGKIPAPAMGSQYCSVIDAHVGDHSAKPEIFLQMIEAYYPTLPKIELNRRGPARKGWTAWGNESEEEAA